MKTLFSTVERRALSEAQTRIFGKAMGLVVRRFDFPEVTAQHVLNLKLPFTVYTVRTPKPHDARLGVVLKKGRRWYYAPDHRASSARGAMPALRSLVTRHILAVMKTEKSMSDGTLESAIEGLGCRVLQRLAHEWGITREWDQL